VEDAVKMRATNKWSNGSYVGEVTYGTGSKNEQDGGAAFTWSN
jgi:hypothetical protein